MIRCLTSHLISLIAILGGGGSGNCKDVYPQYCPGYKQQGMCTDPNYLDYVKEVCKYTCNLCGKFTVGFLLLRENLLNLADKP